MSKQQFRGELIKPEVVVDLTEQSSAHLSVPQAFSNRLTAYKKAYFSSFLPFATHVTSTESLPVIDADKLVLPVVACSCNNAASRQSYEFSLRQRFQDVD